MGRIKSDVGSAGSLLWDTTGGNDDCTRGQALALTVSNTGVSSAKRVM
jgi:hypothetical protein